MKRLALTALMLAFPILSSASAQTIGEMVAVTGIVSTLSSSGLVSFPSGTSFVKNPAYANQLAASLLGAEIGKYVDIQLYVAGGLIARLADTYANNLATNFASAGFLQSAPIRAFKFGQDIWTRTDYSDDSGKTRVMFVAKTGTGVRFITAVRK